ncbi:Electron transport complex protein RnfG [hydrothermal vent metagenome]|uniref:Electron transport complex protein RnfG n=1 Tax=hydrothermal vent metagenome TaxID=652676 RepID=A0A3B1C2B9_9ZZZZ
MTEQVKEPAYKKRISYHGALLAGFATLAASLLVMGNISTRDTIELRLAEDLQASLNQVLPESLHDNNLLNNRISIQHKNHEVIAYQGIKNNQTSAVAYGISGQGYAGEINLIMAVNSKGEILGVRVLSHAETPGLGDKIEAEKDDWIFSFNGLSLSQLSEDQWKVKKDGGKFDQFSGATITPRAVVKAVKQGLNLFSLHRAELLAINPLMVSKKKSPEPQKAAIKSPLESEKISSTKR